MGLTKTSLPIIQVQFAWSFLQHVAHHWCSTLESTSSLKQERPARPQGHRVIFASGSDFVFLANPSRSKSSVTMLLLHHHSGLHQHPLCWQIDLAGVTMSQDGTCILVTNRQLKSRSFYWHDLSTLTAIQRLL